MRTWRRFFLIMGLMMGLTACGAVRPPLLHRAFSDDLEAAHKLITTGHLKQAVDELTLLIDMDPKNEEALFLRGTAYQGLEEFEPAVKDYESVIRTHPDSPKAHYNLGMILAYKLLDPQQALKHFDRFLTLAPSHERAFPVAKIMCSLDQRQPGADSPVPHFLLGQAYEKEGKTEEAIRSYQEAIHLRPTCGPCHQMLGRLLLLKKHPEEAQDHLSKAKLFNS